MLQEHPRLAIPPEAHWVVESAPRRGRWSPERWTEVLDEIMRHPKYADWQLPAADARAAVAGRRFSSYPALVSALFAAYAKREGKPRWGDKTPENVPHLEFLSGLFPRSVFIHVIRDGRNVAASLADQVWASDGLVGKAYWWRDCVTAGRRAGQRLGPARYCEVRLEDLIADPEGVLKRVCSAIGEAYMPQMLEYTRSSARIDSWPHRYRRSHQHLRKPPTAGLRDWTAGISPGERDAVIRICRPLLRELGYDR
jgi:hypothetical protein